MKCANPPCGKRIRSGKPWKKYCDDKCGDAARQRKARRRMKRRAARARKAS